MVQFVFATRQLDGANYQVAAADRREFERAAWLLKRARSSPTDPMLVLQEHTILLPSRKDRPGPGQSLVSHDTRPGSELFVAYSIRLRHLRGPARVAFERLFEQQVDELVKLLAAGDVEAAFRDGGSVEVPEIAIIEARLGGELEKLLPWHSQHRNFVLAGALAVIGTFAVLGAWHQGMLGRKVDTALDDQTRTLAAECGLTPQAVQAARAREMKEAGSRAMPNRTLGDGNSVVLTDTLTLRSTQNPIEFTVCQFTRNLSEASRTLAYFRMYLSDIEKVSTDKKNKEELFRAFHVPHPAVSRDSTGNAWQNDSPVSPRIFHSHREILSDIQTFLTNSAASVDGAPSLDRPDEAGGLMRACRLANSLQDHLAAFAELDRRPVLMDGSHLFVGLLAVRVRLLRQLCDISSNFNI